MTNIIRGVEARACRAGAGSYSAEPQFVKHDGQPEAGTISIDP